MGVLNSSRKAMKGFIEKSYSMGQLHGEMKKINDPRRQNLIETVHLTKAEENKIDTLFVSTYGKKIKYDWHRLYQSFTGKFDENYFPEYLFSSVLEPKMNPMDYRYVLDDKLLLPLFCVVVEHVRTPRTYYSVCDGICFDEEKNIVDLRFIDEFDLLQSNKTPLFMLVFPFIQSFCAIRTHITIALILLAIVALKNRRNILMWGLLIASVFIQRASLIYAIFPIFYFYYKKNKMTMKKATAFIIIGCAVGYIGKKVIIGGSIGYLTGGVYANYASASSSAGYLFDYIKLIVEQVIIDGYMILSYKKVNGQLQEMEELEKEKLRMLQMMCYFDLMLIPICYILGIWRGASYFFLPRLLILGYIITDFSRKISKNSRKAYYMIVKVAMPIWLVLRLFTVYDVSGLMPYYLDFRL